MANFAEALQSMDNTMAFTENGARGYRSTGKALLDLNFSISSLRGQIDKPCHLFRDAFMEDPNLAMKFLFFLRDVRGGMGERDLFRKIMTHIMITIENTSTPSLRYTKWEDMSYSQRLAYFQQDIIHMLRYIPEYGRWDDVIHFWYISSRKGPFRSALLRWIRNQFNTDLITIKEYSNQHISLLGKWMPSINTSSKKTVNMGRKLAREMGLSEREYRKKLVILRQRIKVIETMMSAKEWDKINYNLVPSNANLRYAKAFLKNDHDRRVEYLDKLKRADPSVKMHASVLFPHDIVNQIDKLDKVYNNEEIDTFNEMWKHLDENFKPFFKNILCVCDTSGSMTSRVSNTSGVTAMQVAMGLTIYFAERIQGGFNGKFITFSEHPRMIDLKNCFDLYDKLNEIRRHSEVADTNIEGVFNLILMTALENHFEQQDMPDKILILSDMEFNDCVRTESHQMVRPILFEEISKKYARNGYKLPELVFWNINSRTGTIPLTENEMGVKLVSGFSHQIAKMVMSDKLDPYEALVETLMSDRYEPIIISNVPA